VQHQTIKRENCSWLILKFFIVQMQSHSLGT
jgi:hypothetical protein